MRRGAHRNVDVNKPTRPRAPFGPTDTGFSARPSTWHRPWCCGLTAEYKKQFPNDTFNNLAVAGGAGSNAKAKLASDLKNSNPPDSFQGHAGAELSDDIAAGQVLPVNDVMAALGGEKVFPKDLLGRLTVEGNIYSIPSNIHRANVVWATRAC